MAITVNGRIYRNLQEQVKYLTDRVDEIGQALGTKADKSSVVQTTGQNTTSVMSQKATTDEIDVLKGDITELQTALIGVSDLIGGDA